ncbi:MAG TPA: GNAT family N-acetyltransferase [Vineibacter sp.]|nr:GNAT family N-acetyltransferase [Vineibacter sp.]
MSDLEMVFDPLPPEALSRLVNEGVDLHNVAATGLAEWYPVGLFLKSPKGEWAGGLLGSIWGGWLHVRSLWVAAPFRGQGHATRLLAAAEAYAIERGCRAATLETHSFQARPLYERLGYEVFGTLDDYPPGHAKYFLRKTLAAPRPSR